MTKNRNKLKKQNPPKLSGWLFWNTNPSCVNWEQNARYVIEKVISRGSLEDWFEIKKYYGLEKIKKEMLQIRYLDRLSLSFCSTLFNIPKNKFRCYRYRQLTSGFWNF